MLARGMPRSQRGPRKRPRPRGRDRFSLHRPSAACAVPRAERAGAGVAWDRIPVVISFAEAKQMVETYGFAGSQGQTVLEGQRLVARETSDTGCVFFHPAK